MTHFQLNYVNDASVVGEPRAFIAAQKYIAIQQMMKFPNSHNVPRYSLNTIKELANVMYDRLAQYRATEIQTEDEMSIAQARVRDMQLQFDIVEAQQQLYIQTEMAEFGLSSSILSKIGSFFIFMAKRPTGACPSF